ncbi:MAG TPA: LysR substrate-binding domain-containing protein [Candidatus Acidoferrum sp.]|nr:LysR substrate-binding domain-containing protein [Candidatus Acidoferrum sp.]
MVVAVIPRSSGIEDLPSINELKTIVFRIGCSYRKRLDNLLNKAGILVAQPLEFGSIEAILGCVAAGVGITLLPKGIAAAAWRDGQVAVHELDPEFAEVQTVFIRRTDGYVSSALLVFLQIVRQDTELRVAAESVGDGTWCNGVRSLSDFPVPLAHQSATSRIRKVAV